MPQRKEYDLSKWLSNLEFRLKYWVLDRRTQMYFIAGLLVWSYLPYLDYALDRNDRSKICMIAGNARAATYLIDMTDPLNDYDMDALYAIKPIGHRSLTRRTVMELPVTYNGLQVPLAEHPSMARLIRRSNLQDNLGNIIADELETYCHWNPPTSPHRYVFDSIRYLHSFVDLDHITLGTE